ncbi:MAG TPA: CBS domain-containing protein [Anaeromyxobacteraceae bacterium]|nr:CBS domain-containing protein [Anaeromyxobacteraceae bacterium]
MQVHEIMTAEPECFRESDLVMEIARRMRELNIGFVPICDEHGRPVGAVTDRDIAIRVAAEDKKASRVHAREIMSHESVTCSDSDEVERAEEVMAEHHKSRLMVVDEAGRLVGVLSLADLFTSAADERALETLQRIAEREARAAVH